MLFSPNAGFESMGSSGYVLSFFFACWFPKANTDCCTMSLIRLFGAEDGRDLASQMLRLDSRTSDCRVHCVPGRLHRSPAVRRAESAASCAHSCRFADRASHRSEQLFLSAMQGSLKRILRSCKVQPARKGRIHHTD